MTLINSSISATPCCSLLLWKLNKTTQAPGKGVRLLELQQEGLRLGQQRRFSEGEGVGEGQGDGAGPPNLRKVPSHPMRMRAQLHIHSTHRLASVSSRRTVPALLGVPDSCPVTPPPRHTISPPPWPSLGLLQGSGVQTHLRSALPFLSLNFPVS